MIKPSTGPLNKRRPILFQLIADHFSHTEIDELVLLMGLLPDHLFGENDTSRQKALALELWAAKENRKKLLLQWLNELRPTVDWEEFE